MTQAQIESFIEGTLNGTLSTQRADVYKLILIKPMSLKQLENYGFSINAASGRTSELTDMGLIKEVKKGKTTEYHPVKIEGDRKIQIELRRLEKYIRWHKQGEKMGFFENKQRYGLDPKTIHDYFK